MPTAKDTALEFLKLAAAGRAREAFDKYVHPDFVHHNPYFAAESDALMKGMEDNAREFPNKKFEVLRTIAEGDLVVVHGSVRMTAESPEIALIHIFRFKDGKIIEEWEAASMEPEEAPNQNGMF